MAKMVNLSIDGHEVNVPEGTLIVDAAKRVGIDVPVFCYHPKMEPVGMCRMCLVDIGRPLRDRASGDLILNEDGSPKIQFGAKLETACTTPVSEGMVVIGDSQKVAAGREDIIEFLLTSHPLDCPICDKGGECPLQNLTMGFGPGESRFIYDDKIHLAKHVPLGELIYLDRERCIQCARCTRFQSAVVDEPVIGFYQRGRSLEIVTFSDPGFDSYFSGNTTDICPVGALTTTDFRFGARPWELNAAASVCTQCPVGCNLTFNVRREAKTGGGVAIKRAMPRQNEAVNEIWICDKGRFGYHYVSSPARLKAPMLRKGSELVETTWGEALELVARRFGEAGGGLLTLAGGRLANEDLFNLKALSDALGGKTALYTEMGGGDLVAQVGVGAGTNLSELGAGDAILVVASDLQEEAPIWWLRVKQAADRGAKLILANARPTKLDKYAAHIVRYPYGSEAAAILAMVNELSAKRPGLLGAAAELARDPGLKDAAKTFSGAKNAVLLYGSDGTGLQSSQALARAAANLLLATNHAGRPNNGLIPVWRRANDQGAWDIGFRPYEHLGEVMRTAKALYIVAADPAGDDPDLAETGDFLVVQDLFLTDTAKLADVVLPVQAFTEREGSFTSGERRVQRFYPAVPEPPDLRPDFAVTGSIAKALKLDLEDRIASKVMARIAAQLPDYAGVSYTGLAQVEEQWPDVGRGDMYYGGTSYENSQGLGIQLTPAAQRGQTPALGWTQPPVLEIPEKALLGVPVTRLYDRGQTLLPSKLLHQRIQAPFVSLHPDTALRFNIADGAAVQVTLGDNATLVTARLDSALPENIVLVPRSFGLPISGPGQIEIRLAERVAA